MEIGQEIGEGLASAGGEAVADGVDGRIGQARDRRVGVVVERQARADSVRGTQIPIHRDRALGTLGSDRLSGMAPQGVDREVDRGRGGACVDEGQMAGRVIFVRGRDQGRLGRRIAGLVGQHLTQTIEAEASGLDRIGVVFALGDQFVGYVEIEQGDGDDDFAFGDQGRTSAGVRPAFHGQTGGAGGTCGESPPSGVTGRVTAERPRSPVPDWQRPPDHGCRTLRTRPQDRRSAHSLDAGRPRWHGVGLRFRGVAESGASA